MPKRKERISLRGRISKNTMAGIRSITTYNAENAKDSGPIQDSYLMNKKEQEKYIITKGYKKGDIGDYGLVKKAVGDRNLPVYQLYDDDVDRNYLVPIGNTYKGIEFGETTYPLPLIHAGDYPSSVYVDSRNPTKFYFKSWDLNDYYGNGSGDHNYNLFEKLGAKFLDKIGNPVVQTTGYKHLDTVDPLEDKHINTQRPTDIYGIERDNRLSNSLNKIGGRTTEVYNMLKDKGYVIEYINGKPYIINKNFVDNPIIIK